MSDHQNNVVDLRPVRPDNGGREIEEAHSMSIVPCSGCGEPALFLRDKDGNVFAAAAIDALWLTERLAPYLPQSS